MIQVVPIPKPEVKGEGRVLYRCASCGELVDPEDASIVAGRSYCVPHAPEVPPEWPPTPASPTP